MVSNQLFREAACRTTPFSTNIDLGAYEAQIVVYLPVVKK
jgi:hypothetical protein